MSMVKKYIKKYELEILFESIFLYKKMIGTMLILLIFSTGLTYLGPMINAYIIDEGITNENIWVLVVSVSVLYATYIILEWLSLMRSKIKSKLTYEMRSELKNNILSYCMQNPNKDVVKSGEIDSLIKRDSAVYTRIATSIVEDVVENISSIVWVSVMLFSMHNILAVIVLLSQIMLVVFQLWANRIIEQNSTRLRSKFIELMSITNEIIENINKLVPIGAGRYAKRRYNSALKGEFDLEYNQLIFERKIISSMSLFTSLITCVTIIVGGYFVVKGQMTVGKLLSFTQYSSMFLSPVIGLLGLPMEMSNNYSCIKSISEIQKQRNRNQRLQTKPNLKNDIQKISIKNLCFSFDTNSILDDVSVVFDYGTPNYIIGQSGVGKSTLAKLLMGQYRPCQGDICYDEQSVNDMDLYGISLQVAYASQDSVIFNDTILNNIVLDSDLDFNRVRQICKDCQIWDKIQLMEEGLDTIISERGENLSGGQKGRVCLARALYANKPVIILDEITSGLDDDTENKIKFALKKYFREKLFIIITHSENFIFARSNVFSIDEKKITKIKRRE